jgi:hypothetical protein
LPHVLFFSPTIFPFLFYKKELEIISLLKKRNRKLTALKTLFSLSKRETEIFLTKEIKNDTCNLFLFSIKEKQKINAL